MAPKTPKSKGGNNNKKGGARNSWLNVALFAVGVAVLAGLVFRFAPASDVYRGGAVDGSEPPASRHIPRQRQQQQRKPQSKAEAAAEAKAEAEKKAKKQPKPASACSAKALDANYTLAFSIDVLRHGARSPIRSFPNDKPSFADVWSSQCDMSASVPVPPHTLPHDAAVPGRCRPGQLTSIGVAQHKAHGEALRKRYVDEYKILPATFDPKLVAVRSTDVPRTIVSVANLMSVLYPDLTTDEFVGKHLHVASAGHETMVPDYENCAAVRHLFNEAKTVEGFTQLLGSEEVTLIKNVTADMFNFTVAEFPSFIALNDILVAQREHGIASPLPNELESAIEQVAALSFNHLLSSSEHLLRYSIGAFVSELDAAITASETGTSSTRVYLYSAHDTTLTPLLAILGVETNGKWLDFASVLELQFFQRKADAPAAAPLEDGTKDFSNADWLVRVTLNDELVQCAPLAALHQRFQQFALPAFRAERDVECAVLPPGIDAAAIPVQTWETGC